MVVILRIASSRVVGKGILCVFVAIFAALRPLLPLCRYLFDLCVIL
mgnify:CR=1 FL=1